jgi:hypothetical protein
MHFDQRMNRMGRNGDALPSPKDEASSFKPSSQTT